MQDNNRNELYRLINDIPVTPENSELIEKIKKDLEKRDYASALKKIEKLGQKKKPRKPRTKKQPNNSEPEEVLQDYPTEISNIELERQFIGLLLTDPRQIVKYFFLYENCYFQSAAMLNIYKSILFTEGAAYTPEIAKNGFNFSKDSEEVYELKNALRNEVKDKHYNIEKIYIELKKLFVLRKNYLAVPIEEIQDKIIEIKDYELYDKMSVEEVESAVIQVNDTGKFKRAILNQDLSSFLALGDNNLTNGLALPFPILTQVFKGIRKGETMAYAMPSNAGKSRFTINLAAYVALLHHKKVLIISNEMSEEKMRLCLITTIINSKEMQKLYKKQISKTEGELLEFKFRPDNPKEVETDEDGFVIKGNKEKQSSFVKRLTKISQEYRDTIAITDWANEQINNSIYFINITDHTNDELKKVIINYYYKEKIEYVFYDTLKTDTANIGIGEELKKTATILSNLAQNFGMFICSTLQLAESDTLPVNLNVNDLAVSRTVKEVLDTLTLMKQIHRDSLQNYEYSLQEVDTKFYELEKSNNPDVRYYACVVDKNRAGAKPTLVFRLNLAYNVWEELRIFTTKARK